MNALFVKVPVLQESYGSWDKKIKKKKEMSRLDKVTKGRKCRNLHLSVQKRQVPSPVTKETISEEKTCIALASPQQRWSIVPLPVILPLLVAKEGATQYRKDNKKVNVRTGSELQGYPPSSITQQTARGGTL